VVLGGAAEYAAETEFGTLWDGVWWAVVTVTTVGYGDLTPHTVGGRVVGIALMFVGISFLSLLTAAIASRFVREERSSEHTEMMDALHQIQAELAELKARTGGY
ncbi:MAG TPA: potassium channel family protein, partial [Gaiellaceae bacterium]|nr:potassium channel family protein [Gaiellaceae bacterium]